MSPLSSYRNLFLLGLLLVFLGAIALRATPRPMAYVSTETDQGQPAEDAATSTVPDLTSASFPKGDALAGLGADWTYVRQTVLSEKSGSAFPGTFSTRESVIHEIGTKTDLVLEEGNIIDNAALQKGLQSKTVTKTQIAGRDAYLVPIASITGGTGLLLVGDTTTLQIQYSQSAEWPKQLDQAVLSYIATARLP